MQVSQDILVVSVGLIEPDKMIFHPNLGFIGETETGLGKTYITINILLVIISGSGGRCVWGVPMKSAS